MTADLRMATDFATSLERLFGFGTHLVLDMGSGAGALEKLRLQDPDLWHAVDHRLKSSLERTEGLLRDHQAELVKLIEILSAQRDGQAVFLPVRRAQDKASKPNDPMREKRG